MVEVILHIGGEKTGSTSIQTSLKSSRQRLAEQGILVPRILGDSNHVGTYVYVSEGDVDELKAQLEVTTPEELAAFRERMRAGLRAEIAALPGLKTIIVSNEHLSARLRTAEELQRVRELFADVPGGATFRLIYFARPQWELIPSLYSTYVKTGGLEKLVYPMSNALHYKLQHLQIVELWRSVFPDAVFEASAFSTADESFDVVGTFARISGLGDGLDEVPDQNVSLSAPAIELMRRFNGVIPRSIAHRFNPARGNIQQLLEAQSGPPFEIPAALQARIADEFAADNAKLNDQFGREVVAPPPDLIRGANDANGGDGTEVSLSLDLDDAIRMLGECFAAKQQQFLQAKARAEKLHKQVQDMRQARPAGGPGRPQGRPGGPRAGG